MSDDDWWQSAPLASGDGGGKHAEKPNYYDRNKAWAKGDASKFITDLSPDEETKFQSWVKEKKVPFDNGSDADYDMRGFWKGLQSGDPKAKSAVDPNDSKLHYPDYWKTPYHETFSAESQWADPKKAPSWNDKDQLVGNDGKVLFDDRAKNNAKEDDWWSHAPLAPAEKSPFAKHMSEEQTADGRLERFGTGVRDVAEGAASLVNRIVPIPKYDPEKKEWVSSAEFDKRYTTAREANIQASRGGETGVDWMRAAGNVAGTLPLAAVAGPVEAGLAASAFTPVENPDKFWTEKSEQVGLGAMAGKAGELGVNALSKLVKPTQNMLMKAGVNLTPGQAMGSAAHWVEEAFKSMPFSGQIIQKAEDRALDDFAVKTTERALAPLGVQKIRAATGREAVQEGQSIINEAYDHVLKQMPAVVKDAYVDHAIMEATAVANKLGPEAVHRMNAIINQDVLSPFLASGRAAPIDGRTFKGVESNLRQQIEGLASSADFKDREIGKALKNVLGELRGGLERQYPHLSPELASVNHAFAAFADVEKAASQRVTSGSRFTPTDLMRAVKSQDKSPRDKQWAAGNVPFQDWAEQAYKTIGSKFPDSGTASRIMHGNLGSWLTGLAASPAVAAAYSPGASEIMNKMATFAPQSRNAIAGMIGNSAPAAGAMAGDIAGNTSNAINNLVGP